MTFKEENSGSENSCSKKVNNGLYFDSSILKLFQAGQDTAKHKFIEHVAKSSSLIKWQNILGYFFKDQTLLIKVITHSSFTHEYSRLGLENNEKLEFIGDSTLGLIVSKRLMEDFSDLNEGEMSKFRSALVNEDALIELAKVIDLDKVLLLGVGEKINENLTDSALMADGVEALIGGVFLDSGFDRAVLLFNDLISLYKDFYKKDYYSLSRLDSFDAKSTLQEKTMALYKTLPEYKSVELENQSFEVSLLINNKVVGMMTHASKKKAQKLLAKKILNEKLYLNKEEG